MGFFDVFRKVGGVAKKAADRAAKEAKYRKRAFEIKMEIKKMEDSVNSEYEKREFEAKKEILAQLKMRQLESICAAKGIPTYRVVIVNGEKKRYKIRNKEELIDVMASHLDLEEVKDIGRRYKLRYRNIIESLERWADSAFAKLEEFKKRKQEELNRYKIEIFGKEAGEIETISVEDTFEEEGFEEREHEFEEVEREIDIFDILSDFRPETVRDEEDFEKQLYQFLKARLGSRVRRQVPVGSQTIDIAIGDEVGIEVKIAESRSKLQRLVGQVLDYTEYFDDVIAVILDVGANVDLEDYARKLQRLGAQVLILEGNIRRKGRKREIVIRV